MPNQERDFKQYVKDELSHSPPTSDQHAQAHAAVSELFLEFGEKLSEVVPDGANGTKMVNFLTIARAWAQKAVAQDWKHLNPE